MGDRREDRGKREREREISEIDDEAISQLTHYEKYH